MNELNGDITYTGILDQHDEPTGIDIILFYNYHTINYSALKKRSKSFTHEIIFLSPETFLPF